MSIVRNLVELDRANQASLRRGRNQSAVETETETETAAAIRIPLAIRILLSLDILVSIHGPKRQMTSPLDYAPFCSCFYGGA